MLQAIGPSATVRTCWLYRFVSMKYDLDATVRRVAEFLEIRVSDEIIREVCRKSSFEYMKSIDERFATYRALPGAARPLCCAPGSRVGRLLFLLPKNNAKWTPFSSMDCRDSAPIFLTTRSVDTEQQDKIALTRKLIRHPEPCGTTAWLHRGPHERRPPCS
jgi:hypothetical protein